MENQNGQWNLGSRGLNSKGAYGDVKERMGMSRVCCYVVVIQGYKAAF